MLSDKISLDYSAPNTLSVKFTGDWKASAGLPAVGEVITDLLSHNIQQINLNASDISGWDSRLVSFLLHFMKECAKRNIQVGKEGLPQGIAELLELASRSYYEEGAVVKEEEESILDKIGDKTLKIKESAYSVLNFLGDITVSFVRLIAGKVYFRWDEFIYIVQRSGASALALISLISLLVGMILAFVGAIQLKMFGAQIFIADIVGIAMVRVMGAVMTGILMSGRTGAAFAAELGLMQTNEEIDALKTLGISPVEFLVLPRLLALVMMLPLLTLYADFMGIVGGFFISVTYLGLNPVEYWHHTEQAVKLSHLWVGLIHGFVFGIIIAVCGCLQGIKCERSAAAVGEATTAAVVTSITNIVIATAIITFVCQVLGI